MLKMLKIELNRAFHNNGMKIVLLLGILLAVLQAGDAYKELALFENLDKSNEQLSFLSEPTLFNQWLGGSLSSFYNNIYYFIVPLLAVLPNASAYFTDVKSGYIKNIYIRTNKRNYIISKYIAVFLSGGVAGICPLVFNYLMVSSFFPARLPDPCDLRGNVWSNGMWLELYYTQPLLYVAFYLILDFIVIGLIACLALLVSRFAQNVLLVLVSPFLVYLAWDFATQLFKIRGCSLLSIVNIGQPAQLTFQNVVVVVLILGFVTFGGFYLGNIKNETY